MTKSEKIEMVLVLSVVAIIGIGLLIIAPSYDDITQIPDKPLTEEQLRWYGLAN